jgi:hypothetical protein
VLLFESCLQITELLKQKSFLLVDALAYSLALKMEAVHSSETLENSYLTT